MSAERSRRIGDTPIDASPIESRAPAWFACSTIARTAWLVAPPASSALTALGRPTLSVAANMAINLGLLPLLPLMMLGFGLTGSGWHAILQGVGASVLLLLLVLRQTRDPAVQTAPA